MESAEPEDPGRARRAKALAAMSVVAVAIACAAYLRPIQQPAMSSSVPGAVGYQIDAVDFVDASTGWVLADLDTLEFAVLETTDAGRHWTRQLVAPSARHGEYMRFFDRAHGVIAAIGAPASVLETRDGGAHWISRTVDLNGGFAISASFVDMDHGWVLVFSGFPDPSSTVLISTDDGGATWRTLGQPVSQPAKAFGITFVDRYHGWLDGAVTGPYALATSDGGATWQQQELTAPAGGWPAPLGSFFVAVRPTFGGGLMATVVNSPQVRGRSAASTSVLGYPPLTVATYDGGRPVIYIYSTLADSTSNGILHVQDAIHEPGPATQVLPANQISLSSTDDGDTWTVFSTPGSGGTIGYSGELNWWWIGPGLRSISVDAGLTWSPSEANAVDDPLPGSLVVVDSKHAWVSAIVGSSSALFKTSDGGAHWTKVTLPRITPI